MSRRTLPDELRSVLLAHALQAPEPDDTVRRVLAGTVAVEQRRPAGRWRPKHVLAAGAAAVLVAVLAGSGYVIDRGQHPAGRTNGASSGTANLTGPQRAADGQLNGNQSGGGPALIPQRPYIAPGETDGVPTNPALPPGLSCAQLLPGSRLRIGSASKVRLAGLDHDLYVYDLLCVRSDSQRSASTVVAYALVNGVLRLQAVLVPASQDSRADYMGSSDNGKFLAVQVLTKDGTLVRQDFTTGDGVHFTGSSYPVAPGCQPSDLTARIARVDSISSAVPVRPYAVLFTKSSPGICVLSGYPTVTAADGTAAGATPTLRGPAGGTGAAAPEIVQLAQFTTVAAMIEPAAQPKCAPTAAVAVTLSDGRSIGVLAAGVPLCGAQVHPIVPNERGSD